MTSSAPVSTALVTASVLDSAGRFIANVGVPAAITFFLLSQITPRLDAIANAQQGATTQLAIIGASCLGRPAVPGLAPQALHEVRQDWVLPRHGG